MISHKKQKTYYVNELAENVLIQIVDVKQKDHIVICEKGYRKGRLHI